MPPQRRLSLGQKRTLFDQQDPRGEEVIATAEKWADRPEGQASLGWARDYEKYNVYSLCDQLQLELTMRAEDGDADGALQICRALINLGRSQGDEPLTFSQQKRVSEVREAIPCLERVLAQGEPSGPALAATQSLLEREEAYPGLQITMRGLRAQLDERLASIQSGRAPLSTYLQEPPAGRTDEAVDERGLEQATSFLLIPGSGARNRAALLRHMNRCVEAAQLPLEQQAAAFTHLAEEAKQLPYLARNQALSGGGRLA